MTYRALAMVSVETVLQAEPPAAGTRPGLELIRQQHRIPVGTTVRGLLRSAGMNQSIAAVEAGTLGLSCHGKRAWLDDVLIDGSRVELMAPIRADAKAARTERVAADRTRRKARFGRSQDGQ